MGKLLHDAMSAVEPALTFAEFYDAALRTPELAIYVIRVNERGGYSFESGNDFFAEVAGKSLSEIVGRPIEEVLLPQIADCLTANLATALKTGWPMAYQRTLDLPAGPVSFKTSLIPVSRGSHPAKYVVGMTRDVTQEYNLVEQAQHQAALLKALGIALPSAIYVLDMDDRSLTFVDGKAEKSQLEWRKGSEDVGPEAGEKYFHPEDWPRAKAHWQELAALKDGEVATISYRLMSKPGEFTRHVNREIVLTRDDEGKVKLVLGVSEDVSEHDKVEQEVRDMSARMLTLQIEERQRIAQELHDSTGQHLYAAALALRNARTHQAKQQSDEADAPLLSAMEDAAYCIQQAQREIRVLSFLLHAPHLRSGGLADALKEFVSGFGTRTGLRTTIEISPGVSKIDDAAAVHLFRVCQEALTNVYRHADAHTVKVKLAVDRKIRLTVKDDGIGFNSSAETVLGLGLPGMRDRMTRLGGDFKVSSDPGGTTLLATIPLSAPSAT